MCIIFIHRTFSGARSRFVVCNYYILSRHRTPARAVGASAALNSHQLLCPGTRVELSRRKSHRQMRKGQLLVNARICDLAVVRSVSRSPIRETLIF